MEESASVERVNRAIQPAPSSLKTHVWRHFTFCYVPGKTEIDMRMIVCNMCKTKLPYRGNATNLRGHLARHNCLRQHPELDEKHPKAADQQSNTLLADSPRAVKISRSIAGYIIKDLRPYSSVEGEGFRFMVNTLEPRYVVPARNFFSDTVVPQLYQETKKKVGEALMNANRVALTCNCWTSRASGLFVTFTAHFITDDWQMKSCVLQTRAMGENPTALNLNAMFQAVAVEWRLNDVVMVTDHAGAPLENNVTCFAHSLNLAAQGALNVNTVAQLLNTIRKVFAFFHGSPRASHMLGEKQKLLGMPAHKLKPDTPRWNSSYEMLERCLEQHPAIWAALLSPQLRKSVQEEAIHAINKTDISHVQEIVTTLKPIKDAADIMSDDATPTLSVVASLHAQLLVDTQADFCDPPVVYEVKRAISGCLAERYTSEQSKTLLGSASTLDPRFKTLPFHTEEQRREIHRKVIDEAAAQKVEERPAETRRQEPSQDEGPSPKRLALVHFFGSTFNQVSVLPKSTRTRAEEELKKYLKVPLQTLSDDPLQWWRFHEGEFPLLSRLAKRYLCIPGARRATGRAFCTAADTLTAQDSALTPDHVDQRLFLQHNLVLTD